MLGKAKPVPRCNQMRFVSSQAGEHFGLGRIFTLLPTHQMTVQLNVVSLGKSLEDLSGEVTIGFVYLMKILNAMGRTRLDAFPLGFGVPRLGGCRSRDSTHDTGGQPAQQGAGIHSGRPTLIFELLRHRVCPRLLCRD